MREYNIILIQSCNRQMIRYPLSNISKEEWNKKVAATYMYSIPAEDQALPILDELVDLLQHLNTHPIDQILPEDHIEYFLTQVFPVVCQKILKSRYFKSPKVLSNANRILELSTNLVAKHVELAQKYPLFAEILITVFNTDEYYYKTNNQLSDYRTFAYTYIKQDQRGWVDELKEGDFIDALKYTHLSGKATWSRGKIQTIKPSKLKVAFLNDLYDETTLFDKTSYMIAPYKTKSANFDWRMDLKVGDIIDCEDHYGGWYGSTILEIIERDNDKKLIKVAFKVYDDKGNKYDERGKYYGLNGYTEQIDVTSPKIQPFGTVVKDRGYYDSGTKSLLDNDDLNDSEFEQLSGDRLYALPRKKCLSEFLFHAINAFGKLGGFVRPLERLDSGLNITFLSIYVKGISGVALCLHKSLIKEIVEKLKPIIERHIFCENEQFLKEFTKERSQMLFSGFKILQRRIYSIEAVYQYENEKKMKLVDRCLQSQALKRKLQGLNQLKDVVKSLTYSSERNKVIKNWIKEQKLFEKIYLMNSHVQLIKKSEDFFRYLINESILEVTDLERLYKIAQKGDYESRISLYKLFQEVSHIFKKPHVDFLIDTILESQQSLVLNEDIDLLNEMSKFSNYFPRDKVRSFFESIILGDNQHETLYEYATKKYSEIVAKGYEMKSCRRDIIHSFINRLTTHNITQVSKVLKGIFEGIGIGEYGKKDLNEILAEENIDEVVIQAIGNNKDKPNWSSIVTEVLNLLGFIYKLSYKVKIYILTLKNIWNQLKQNEDKKKEYYKWVNQLVGCEQGIGQYNELEEFELFFRELFPLELLHSIRIEEFSLMKNLILELNKKNRCIVQVHTTKLIQYRRKVEMYDLKLYEYFLLMIYEIRNPEIYERSLEFFLEIYNARENDLKDINTFYEELLQKLDKYKENKEEVQIEKTLKLINTVIDNSEKKYNLQIQSLITKEKSENITIIVINDIIYINDYTKKKEFSVPLNMTLYQFKKTLTTHYSIEFDEIKLSQEREIPDYYNSRTIKELPINYNDPITISRMFTSSYTEPEMMINNKLNPKAVRCFKVIFQKYSLNGHMSKEQCHDFTCTCLGTISKRYDDKINKLYTEYDFDNDGYLDIIGFISFYEDAARQNKTSTVWSNLRSFGVTSDFKFPYEADLPIDFELFPRKKLADNPAFYETLFELLHNKKIAPLAFQLLQRLPISKKIYHETLGIGKAESLDILDIENIFKFEDHYSYFYKLKIISYLSQSSLQVEKKWLKLFIMSEGVELLYSKLKGFMDNYDKDNKFENIEIEIINYNIKLLYQYFLRCFTDQKKQEALALLNYDVEIDDKIEYLVTGFFPKVDEKLIESDIQKIYEWKGDAKTSICEVFIHFLRKIWIEWSDKIEKEHSKMFTYQKVLSIICLLQVDQNPELLIQQFSAFFQKPPSNRLLRQFYCLILTLCFYSSQHQNLYINEMFKHITQTNIISEYFRILAVLVSKFGMQEESVCEMPEILLKNILNEKNQLTIEGCAKLLSNFHLGKEVAEKEIELLWDNCLFGKETSCKKEQTRQAIYQLILRVCESSKEITDKVIKKTLETIQVRIKAIKITYSTEVNQRSTTSYAGLKNLGNICYMNSMIQQLYMNKNFRYLLMRIDDHKDPNWALDSKERMVDDNFLHQIQKIFGFLEHTTRIDYVPSAFCVAYKPFGESVNIMMQQDVQEFVSMFFDRLQNGIKEHPLRRLVDNFYTGKYTNLFDCHECKQTKKVEENFYSLSLEVKNSKTLSESFNRFILGELINDYKCDFCNKKADVSKKTRISKSPQILIVHLQRIVFNLDTFINEKITSKHEFPTEFNLYPFSLDYYEREQQADANLVKENPDYQYELTGIICHIGNAEMGHYISYIKNDSGKWFEFNDSLINSFNPANIEAECFGGSISYEDEYDWEKRENSKSAYLLIYQKVKKSQIEMEVKSEREKVQLLNELKLSEIQSAEAAAPKIEEEHTESQEESSEVIEDSEKEKEYRLKIEMEQIEMIRKHKSEDNIDVDLKQKEQKQKWSKDEQPKQEILVVKIKDEVEPYLSNELKQEIEADNEIHFFEKCLASASFSKFFAKLLILPQSNSQQMVTTCQKLTFGFWLKSPGFKQLLFSLSQYIKEYPSGLREIITENTNLVTLLIENSEIDVRTNIANFLANSFSYYIDDKQLTLLEDDLNEDNQLILKFLNNLFSLIPTTVSKCWTKFNQYFEFWYEFSRKGQVAAGYMIRKEFLKHFIDYFLDKKSPLKIYINRPAIGSQYANPNFTMLLKTIESLLEFDLHNKIDLSNDEKIIILNFNFIEKLIHETYESIASKIVKIICPNNLHASEKIAIVLVKGLSKSNYENVQPYLDVLHEFVLIEDEHQLTRMKWVLGKQSLVVSTISKTLSAMNSYSLEDRIYEFTSGLHIESGTTLLQPIFSQNKRTENLCILCLQELLKLCNESLFIREFIWALGPPSYLLGKYVDFFEEFINRYIDEAKRIYGYSTSTGFNKEQLGKNVKKLYDTVLQKIHSRETTEQEQNKETEAQTGKVEEVYIEAESEKVYPIQINPSDDRDIDSLSVEQQKLNDEIKPQELNRNESSDKNSDMPNLQKINSGDSDYDYYVYNHKQNSSEYSSNEYNIVEHNEEIKINVEGTPIKSVTQSDKQNNYYSSEEQNLLEESTKKKEETAAQQKQVEDVVKIYHPVKFNYKMIEELESGLDNVRIDQHQSELILVRTYPTGITNKAFVSTYSHKKVSERLNESAWEDQKSVTVKGYFITNNTKSPIRLQTEDGSYLVRSLDSAWVWSSHIMKIWVPERFSEWPEWSLYSEQSASSSDVQFEDI